MTYFSIFRRILQHRVGRSQPSADLPEHERLLGGGRGRRHRLFSAARQQASRQNETEGETDETTESDVQCAAGRWPSTVSRGDRSLDLVMGVGPRGPVGVALQGHGGGQSQETKREYSQSLFTTAHL